MTLLFHGASIGVSCGIQLVISCSEDHLTHIYDIFVGRARRLGLAGTVIRHTYSWPLQHGGLRVVGLLTWWLMPPRVRVLMNKVEAIWCFMA